MDNINGIIVINKEKGYTSHDVVAKVKRILGLKKVGHTGTLDPNATGVLPLLLNDGTKLSKYLIEHDKEYVVTLKFGIKTDTADIEGNVINEDSFRIQEKSKEDIEKVLEKFVGVNMQTPPAYSAIKVNGKKLYEYAREGKLDNTLIKPRQIEIYEIDLISINNEENEIKFRVSCSKGTYIRSLCEDIAKELNTIGYMKDLNRTQVGIFSIDKAVTVDELENKKNDINFINEHIISIKDFFNEYRNIILEDIELKKFLNGIEISVEQNDGIVNIYNNEAYIGIGIVNNKKLKREIVIKM